MKNKQLSIEKAWENRSLLADKETIDVIEELISFLDKGKVRIAELIEDTWRINEWVRKAILLYFEIRETEIIDAGPFQYHDKIALKKGFDKLNVRVVPNAIARYGSYIAPDVSLMPSFINIGAYIDSGSNIGIYSSVGSCVQIGKNVILKEGVYIGGICDPTQSTPVIIEDNCFIGSRCLITENVHIERDVVIGANTVITKTTKIIDVTGIEAIEFRRYIPAFSIVIPGTMPKKFPAGEYNVPVALIIGKRKDITDKKESLNNALREYSVSV